MKVLQHINKLCLTISVFWCGQVLYSQIPKEATFPIEIAELIGIKMCDDYILSYNDHDSFEINENISLGSKDSIFIRCSDKKLTEREYYKMVNSSCLLVKNYKFLYDENSRIVRLEKGDYYSDLKIEYVSDDKIIVKSPILTGKSYLGIRIEYILNDDGFLKNFKQFQFPISSEEWTDSDGGEWQETTTSESRLKSTGIIICN